MTRNVFKCLLTLLVLLLLTGCARKPTSPTDPYEGFNRAMFALNQDVDHLVYRPVAKVYQTIIPSPLRKGVGNAFANIEELTTMPNDLLQGKVRYFFIDLGRFVINSTLGIGGLFDVATHMGVAKHYEDFGMTLAYWSGSKKAPYFVIPLIGPSTFRDAFGMPFNTLMSPWPYFDAEYSLPAYALKYINIRTNYLDANKLIDTAFDPYVFVRHAYLQYREALIAENKLPFHQQRAAERARMKENATTHRSVSARNST